MGLRVVRGKEPVIVWRRTSWTSMPHLINQVLDGITTTVCGHEVGLGYGVVSIVQTQITSEMFLGIGCGLCRMSLMRDLRDELLAASPDMRQQFRTLLKGLDWSEPRAT